MTIWLLALVLLASLAGLGYRQGAIRVGFSFIGILLGALLAWPLGKFLKPAILALGVKNPVVPGWVGPVVVFVIISIIFKVCALMVHQKVDVYYKYKAGDLRLALWERLNARTGLCVGLLNGTAYLVLIVAMIYPWSYWTYQLGGSAQDPKWMKILNRLGQDIQNTGFSKVARALDPMPKVWYDSADLASLIYLNPLLEARLSRYPAYFTLAERPEFQDLATDKEFLALRSRQAPIMDVLGYAKVANMLQDPNLLKAVWDTTAPDMQDLRTYLETGKSPKYDPNKLLGHWRFNCRIALSLMVKAKPNINSIEMKKLKAAVLASYSKTTFVAKPDHSCTFKHLPAVKFSATASTAGGDSVACQWQEQDGKYVVSFNGNEVPTIVDEERLAIGPESAAVVFDRED
jgi:hypothetical protein